ncbi:HAD family hydrolase [Lacticaseibacillus mingshuiensis]|uniref:HAD family hydrolase n=1 Tax=Lacticaseibacillus mingshuiensis TaxID=2799574 RepID=UPI00194EDC22|nr:HAD family phosphatase [Lacticaseibacillus mingshuiensis]
MIRQVMFDMDGTLIDSERLFLKANAQAATELGVPHEPTDFLPLVGTAGADGLAKMTALVGAANVPVFAERSVALVMQWVQAGVPIACPGAAALLQRLQTRGLRLVLVTSSDAAYTRTMLETAGLRDYFAAVHTRDGAKEKPDPALYLQALATPGSAPASATVAVEDTVIGVQAARAAGLRALQVVDLDAPAPSATARVNNLAEAGDWLCTFA